jgi:hypothetical protein
MNDWLSVKAQKNMEEAAARARAWLPLLDVDDDGDQVVVIVRRPLHGSRQTMRDFAAWMKANLPELAFDGRRDRWSAALPHIEEAVQVLESAWRITITRQAQEAINRLNDLDECQD